MPVVGDISLYCRELVVSIILRSSYCMSSECLLIRCLIDSIAGLQGIDHDSLVFQYVTCSPYDYAVAASS